jgi:uncharacterized lipoprotein YmbA
LAEAKPPKEKNDMWSLLNKIVVLLYVACLLGGCAGVSSTHPIRYYLIDPAEYPSALYKAGKPLKIEIINLHIPQYLERFHIATRSSKSQLEFSESNQWGENLGKNLLRTMARNLSKLLSTMDIGTPLNRSASIPDYLVQIHIEQFEQESDNRVKLVARWQLSGSSQSKPSEVFSAELQSKETAKDNSFEHRVSVMRQLYGKLSERIAETIIGQEK